MPMSRAKLEGALSFFDDNLPELIGGGLDPVVAANRIRVFLLEASHPDDHGLLNARFDTLLEGIQSGALPAPRKKDPAVLE